MASIKALGKITPSGVTQLSSTEDVANSVVIKAWDTNTGKVYIGESTLAKATLTGCYFFLDAGEVFSMTAEGVNPLNPTEIYLETDNDTEYVVAGLQVL